MEYAEGTADQGATEGPDLESLKSHVLDNSRDAAFWIDSDIAPIRDQAERYYRGDKFGNEEEGRSQIVLTEVRDSILAILPAIMRVFFSGEKAVEFIPNGPEDVANAEQATDYVNHIIQKDNNGFEIFYSAFKDALKKKVGIVKWWWDESFEVTSHEFSGLNEQALIALVNEPGVEVTSHESAEDGTHGVVIKRRRKKKKVCVACVPPEEFLINRTAKSIDESSYLEHRSEKRRGELVAMGYDPEVVAQLHSEYALDLNSEKSTRNASHNVLRPVDDTIIYREALTYFDLDEDGIEELIKVCFVGKDLLHVEPVDEKNYATFCPDPEPHTFFGQSEADKTMDLQLIKSTMMRLTLDSAAQSVHQRLVAVEGQVNMADVLNNEMGAVIRARAPGMVQALDTAFLGQYMLPLMGYMDEIKEARTGQSKASQGLDADALQSTTRAAVAATVSAAAARQELVARIFAETGMKRVFRGILRLVTKHQDQARMIRLRNEWVPIDPRTWYADMDVSVNVALGAGTTEERVGFLNLVAQKQEAILTQFGPDNPLVTPIHLYNTYSEMLSLQGFKDPNKFWQDPRSWQPPPPKPDPAEQLIQLQMEELRIKMATSTEELRIKQQQVALEQDFKRDELDAHIILESRKIEAQHKTTIDLAAIKSDIDRFRAETKGPAVVFNAPPKKIEKKVIRDAEGLIVGVQEIPVEAE